MRLTSQFSDGYIVTIDPRVCFGRPQVMGIPTKVIYYAYKNGSSIEETADEYSLPKEAVLIALTYEGCVEDRREDPDVLAWWEQKVKKLVESGFANLAVKENFFKIPRRRSAWDPRQP